MVPPSATDVPLIVIDEFANLVFAIEPASIVFVTVAISESVTAVPDILDLSIAAEALISALRIVPSAIIVDVTVPAGAENVPVNAALLIGAYAAKLRVAQDDDVPSVVKYFPVLLSWAGRAEIPDTVAPEKSTVPVNTGNFLEHMLLMQLILLILYLMLTECLWKLVLRHL